MEICWRMHECLRSGRCDAPGCHIQNLAGRRVVLALGLGSDLKSF